MDINGARKSIKETRINYNSHEASKTIFLAIMLVDRYIKQSRKNNSENLTRFRDGLKTENFKKIKFS